MPPKLNHERAVFVLGKIDEILAWEQRKDTERDTKFVELGRYLCEVRAGQYWRIEKLKSFDDFLARRFPESRRKAYYLMSIHAKQLQAKCASKYAPQPGTPGATPAKSVTQLQTAPVTQAD